VSGMNVLIDVGSEVSGGEPNVFIQVEECLCDGHFPVEFEERHDFAHLRKRFHTVLSGHGRRSRNQGLRLLRVLLRPFRDVDRHVTQHSVDTLAPSQNRR